MLLSRVCRIKFFYAFILCVASVSICYSQSDNDSTTTAINFSLTENAEIDLDFIGKIDTTFLARKSFNEAEVQKLKGNKELNYKEVPTVAESLWDRLLTWLNNIVMSLFAKATMTDLGRIFMYALGVIALIIIIMALLKVNAFRIFSGNADQGKFGYNVLHENIHEMDFDKLIREAVDKHDFRVATRLVFLNALKLLSEKHLIQWQVGKTNHDYVEEIATSELKTGLNELSFYFDYAWYGNFNINHEQYQKVDTLFQVWRTKIN